MAFYPNTKSRPPSKLSRPESANRDKSGKEILYDNFYYDVSDWVKVHPGGRVIDFYTETGEDATMAIQQFHHRASNKVMGILKSFRRRPANDSEIAMDKATLKRHKALTEDFVQLHRQLEAESLFKPSPVHVISRILELVFLLTVAILLLNVKESIACNLIGIILHSLYRGRCGFLMHEGGHWALSGNIKVDKFLEIFIVGFGLGMSGSWWSSQHNRHHAMTQRMHRDADLNTMPLMVFNAGVAKNSKYCKSFWIRHQAFFFWTLNTSLATYLRTLYLHPRYVILKKKYDELAIMILHHVLVWYYVGLWPYVISTCLMGTYLFGTISLSHSHLPVTTKALHWVEYGLLHTMDMDSSWWCDWWMGYLNYQIEHHLFPSIPHFRLYRIRDKVKSLAAKHGIPYQCVSYSQAVKMTYNNLVNVAKELQQ